MLGQLKDLRLLYCDPKILKDRIARKVCLIDHGVGDRPQDATEVAINKPMTLEDVVDSLDIPYFRGRYFRYGSSQPIITVIGSHYIVRHLDTIAFNRQEQRVGDLAIRPGDLIVIGRIVEY